MINKRIIVGVMGSGTDPYSELSQFTGSLIARLGCHLLTGGGSGVMEAVSRAFCETQPRDGLSIGILKGQTEVVTEERLVRLTHHPASPNPWIEIPVYSHLPDSGQEGRQLTSRNHINVLSADVLIALPGNEGTHSEVTLRADYGRDVILYLGNHFIAGHCTGYYKQVFPRHILIAESEKKLEILLRRLIEKVNKD